MVNVNDFPGLCDNEVIEQAIANRGVDGIIDTKPVVQDHGGMVLLGAPDSVYGKNLPDGLRNVLTNNLLTASE